MISILENSKQNNKMPWGSKRGINFWSGERERISCSSMWMSAITPVYLGVHIENSAPDDNMKKTKEEEEEDNNFRLVLPLLLLLLRCKWRANCQYYSLSRKIYPRIVVDHHQEQPSHYHMPVCLCSSPSGCSTDRQMLLFDDVLHVITITSRRHAKRRESLLWTRKSSKAGRIQEPWGNVKQK